MHAPRVQRRGGEGEDRLALAVPPTLFYFIYTYIHTSYLPIEEYRRPHPGTHLVVHNSAHGVAAAQVPHPRRVDCDAGGAGHLLSCFGGVWGSGSFVHTFRRSVRASFGMTTAASGRISIDRSIDPVRPIHHNLINPTSGSGTHLPKLRAQHPFLLASWWPLGKQQCKASSSSASSVVCVRSLLVARKIGRRWLQRPAWLDWLSLSIDGFGRG